MKGQTMPTPPHHLITFLAIGLSIGLATGCERAEPATPPDTSTPTTTPTTTVPLPANTNAAEQYRAIFADIDPQLVTQLADAQGATSLDAGVRAAAPIVERLVAATTLARCDWDVDYSAGFDTSLPHLKELRSLAQLLRADAERALRTNDTATAAADVAALIRMSSHVGGKSVIEVLVAFGLLTYGTDLTTEHADAWTANDRSLLRTALSPIDPFDLFASNAALEWDKRRSAQEYMPPTDAVRFKQTQAKVTAGLRAAVTAVE